MDSNGKSLDADDFADAQAAAERFLAAIDKGDHGAVWELFSENAQAYVLNRAVDRGMDFDLMSAIRQGTAPAEELETYREGLLEGLRRDLRGVDIPRLAFESKPEPETAGHVRVVYLLEMDMAIGDKRPSIPAGSIHMAPQQGEWKVERVIPRPG